MSQKKPSPQESTTQIQDQLRSLYHRRSAIDRLIQSLEEYRCAAPTARIAPMRATYGSPIQAIAKIS